MLPEVYDTLKSRWEVQGRPEEGWVFPSISESGHLEQGSSKNQHAGALKKLKTAHDAYVEWTDREGGGMWVKAVWVVAGLDAEFIRKHADVIKSGLKPFQPYCLRHTALTRLAEAGCDAFTLARIAGHSSITITQRYCHPQADAIERAFRKLGRHKNGHSPGFTTKSGSEKYSITDLFQNG